MLSKIKFLFQNDWNMEIVVFVCGFVLMSLEIVGGRLLMAEYGGTVYVWGAIISVVLGGLSIGYSLGGRFADKKPNKILLASIIFSSGVFILLIPLFYSKVVFLFSTYDTIYSPLIVVSLFFLLPSILLGMVSPFSIKLKTRNIESVGGVSGNLYALATLGSVLGTFITTFVIILWLPISLIFYILSICLVGLSFLLISRLRIVSLFFLISILILIFIFRNKEEKHLILLNESNINLDIDKKEKINENDLAKEEDFKKQWKIDGVPQEEINVSVESLYGNVKVIDGLNGFRSMYINDGVMGTIFVNDKFKTVTAWGYVELFEYIASLAKSGTKDILNLGVGPGLVAMRLSEKHKMYVDAVDINKVVLDLAQKYFGLISSEYLSLYDEDARVFVKRIDKKYDVIEMDAFKYNKGVYNIPPHLTTKEFFQEVKNKLRNNGIFSLMVVDENNFMNSEYMTLNSVFKNIYTFECDPVYILVASDGTLDFKDFSSNLFCKQKFPNISPDVKIFTDDFTPINQFGN